MGMKIYVFQAILFLTSLVTADLVVENSSFNSDLDNDEGIDGKVENALEAETQSHVLRGQLQLLSHKSKSKSYSSKSYSSYKSKTSKSYSSYYSKTYKSKSYYSKKSKYDYSYYY